MLVTAWVAFVVLTMVGWTGLVAWSMRDVERRERLGAALGAGGVVLGLSFGAAGAVLGWLA